MEQEAAEEAMGLGEALLALRMVQTELPSNFDSFFARLQDNKSDLELTREIRLLRQRAQERKTRKQSSSAGGLMSYASTALQSVVPARVQAFVEYAKQDVIRKQLLYDPNAAEEEQESVDISVQELALEVKQAAASGVLFNNVLDLSEQVITQHFGTSEVDFNATSKTERMVGMAKQVSLGVRERFPFGVSSLFLPSARQEDEDLGGVDDWDDEDDNKREEEEDTSVNDNLVD